ncbi:hypothetical protein SSAG_02971 [Streptomyces sp. Mg1]|nr:hypothetical protein SSAG_02971 [Streptomyces sp. Mg1]
MWPGSLDNPPGAQPRWSGKRKADRRRAAVRPRTHRTHRGKHETAATTFVVTTVSSMWARGDLNPHVPKDTGT